MARASARRESPPSARSGRAAPRRTPARRPAERRAGAAPPAEPATTLQELRRRSGKTQSDVALASGVTQIEISRAERRVDHKTSTLRRYVKALGGELVVFARLGGRMVRLRGV